MLGHNSSARHLTDEELVRLADEELPLGRRRAAKKHVAHCWGCRSRLDALQSTIIAIVRHCDLMAEQLGPAPNQWRGFERRLEQQSTARFEEPKVFHYQSSGFFPQLTQPRFVISAVLVVALLCVFFSDSLVPAARASEILRQASTRDVESLRTVTDPVIHQHLELISGTRRAEWELWRTALGRDLRSAWHGDAALRDEFLKTYRGSDLAGDRPLSPAAFLRWQSKPGTETISVRETGGESVAILCRLSDDGAVGVEQSSLTLNRPGLHPVAQTMQVRTASGRTEYQLRELSYAVMPLREVQLPDLNSKISGNLTPAPSPSERWDPVALENAEADARLLLHENGADLEFAPQIERRRGAVTVNVGVGDEQQQASIKKMLANLPHVVANVWTPNTVPGDASFRQKQTDAGLQPLHRTEALMGDSLTRCLGSMDAANVFVARIHDTVHSAMVPALALEGLANRYQGKNYELLSSAERAGINRIADDYLAALAQYAIRLNADLDPVFHRCLEVQGFTRPALSSGNALAGAANWRQTGPDTVAYIRHFDLYFNLLFATQVSTTAPVSSEQAIDGLLKAGLDFERSALQTRGVPAHPSSDLTSRRKELPQ